MTSSSKTTKKAAKKTTKSPAKKVARKAVAKKPAKKATAKTVVKNPGTKKPAGKKKPATKKAAKKSVKLITASERQSMIAEAAYFAAESFGFGGDSHGHWLYAEAQIDAGLAKGGVQVSA